LEERQKAYLTMNELTQYIGKTVRFEYVKNGQKHVVVDHLKTVQEDRIKVGDTWLPTTGAFIISEVEYKGS